MWGAGSCVLNGDLRRRGSVEAYRRCQTLSRATGHRHGQAAPAAEPPRRRPHAQPPTETPRRTAPASNLYTTTPPRRRPPQTLRRKPADQPQAQPRPRRKELLETTAVPRHRWRPRLGFRRGVTMQSHRPPSYSASPTTGTTGLIHAARRRGTPRKRTRQPTQHL